MIPRLRTCAVLACVVATVSGAAGPACAADSHFVHPGGLHTQIDLDRMKAKVAAGEHPWIDGWNLLIADPKAQNTYEASPKPNMGVSRQRAQDDARSAYLDALRWAVSGDMSYADCAVRNLNGWSAAVNQVPSGTDQPGLGGIPIGTFALAAELLRTYPGWGDADQHRFKTMLLTYFYPAVDDFLENHRNAHPTTYWANWDAANVLSLLAIGVYCDDRAKFDQGVAYYKNGIGMGSITHAVPFLYPGHLGQWQESGRDHAHAFGGLGLLAEACQVAWNQNVDLFGYADDRLLAGANYESRYAQWIGVPYTFYTNAQNANQYWISPAYRGRLSNSECYELLYNHYAVRLGRAVPDVRKWAEISRPEGGNVDLMGYGTLTYTLDAAKSPIPAVVPPVPQDLTATASAGRVYLKWSPSGAYTARGYAVFRAVDRDGPYAEIFSTDGLIAPEFIDTQAENGKTYFYAVAAVNQAGTSDRSAPASATPAALGDLPDGWTAANLGAGDGTSQFAAVAGGTFVIRSTGTGIGGTADACRFNARVASGDFTITARLTDKNGTVQKVGLMVRQSAEPDAPTLALTVGETGGRQARFGTRSQAGGKWTATGGNDYTGVLTWMRLQRVGRTFTASQSQDGITWFVVGKSDVAMTDNTLVGMAISCAKPGGEPATATFDHVTFGVTPPVPPTAPTRLRAAATKADVTLEWDAGGGAADSVRVESSDDGKNFYEIATLPGDATRFVNTAAAAGLSYRVRRGNGGGFSAYSDTAGASAKADVP